jgi:hypothetical protein
MGPIPFTSGQELYRNLHISSSGTLYRHKNDTQSTYTANSQATTLPGHPNIRLRDPNLSSFLQRELVTHRLDTIGARLWLMAKQDSSHISSLTHQHVRGRRIVITENPELHLVWIYDRIFIKPLPKYLLSHAFWEFYFTSRTSPIRSDTERAKILKSARGFLRTYAYLIQHKSDFLIAMDEKHRLLPKKIRYSDFIRFITACQQHVTDEDVSPRYAFGELRLSRLNFWSKLFLHQSSFQKIHGQYGARFAQYYGPLLFVFAALSVVLSAMQVAMAALSEPLESGSTRYLVSVSWVFSIFSLMVVVALTSSMAVAFLFLVSRETLYALKDLVRKRRFSL